MTGPAMHADLVAALGELTNPPKKAKANLGHGKPYEYADLASILNHVRPILLKHGLAVLQDVHMDDNRLSVTTVLHHTSGQSLRFGPLTGPAGAKWQDLGSAITYARRYALCSALGIAGDDDDDGASAPVAPPEPAFASDDTVQRWADLLRDATTTDELKAVADEIRDQHVRPAARKALQSLYAERIKTLTEAVPDAV